MATPVSTTVINQADELRRKALAAKSAKQEKMQTADAERNERIKTTINEMFADLQQTFLSSEFQAMVTNAADRGHDSVALTTYYLPGAATKEVRFNEEGVECLYETRLTPQDKTYVAPKGCDLDSDGFPAVMLLQGPKPSYKPGVRQQPDPSLLPGGQTVLDLFNAWLHDQADMHCVLEFVPDRNIVFRDHHDRQKRATKMVLMIIWDLDSYSLRLKAREVQRELKRQEKSGRRTMTLDQYQATQVVTNDGFVKVKVKAPRPSKH